MVEKSKKILIILCSCIVIGLLCVGFALAFVVGYNPYRPNKLQVIDDGNSVYLFADMNDNYKSYRFKFENSETGDLIVDSTKNLLTTYDMFRSGVVIGEEYNISVCYLSDDSVRNSQFSESITWKPYSYLQSPSIYYDVDHNVIRWEDVENADFYEVYYNCQNEEKMLKVQQNSIDLQLIDGGQRDIYVVAKSNKEYHKPSLNSNTLEIGVIHEISNFSTISLDTNTKILYLTSSEKISKMRIFVNNNSYEKNIESVKDGDVYTYAVDITEIYQTGASIGVCPVTIDSYNVYTSGDVLYLQ